MRARRLSPLTMLVATLLAGCGTAPGQPRRDAITPAPNENVEFSALYGDNCAGCHGASGRGGAAIALANPVYLAIVDEHSLRTAVADGVHGTSMPAFAQRAGGMLTEQQIDALVNGIRSGWDHREVVEGANPPSYASTSAGDIHRGQAAYETFCESCHGKDGDGGPKGSAITNDSFLALASDQYLRTIVIAGRPELGAPDWRGYIGPAPSSVERPAVSNVERSVSRSAEGPALSGVERRPMSDQEVTDVVSWLASHRVAAPGQPYVAERSASGGPRVE